MDPANPAVTANLLWLDRLLDILIDNALHAMRVIKKKTLSINTSVEKKMVRIRIHDTGRGIDSKKLTNLFDKPHAFGKDGSGRGIYVARLITDIYGGSIAVETTNNTGTALIVRLPKK
jgi:sensor histidine kinase regulating citrate/malate metabolism